MENFYPSCFDRLINKIIHDIMEMEEMETPANHELIRQMYHEKHLDSIYHFNFPQIIISWGSVHIEFNDFGIVDICLHGFLDKNYDIVKDWVKWEQIFVTYTYVDGHIICDRIEYQCYDYSDEDEYNIDLLTASLIDEKAIILRDQYKNFFSDELKPCLNELDRVSHWLEEIVENNTV